MKRARRHSHRHVFLILLALAWLCPLALTAEAVSLETVLEERDIRLQWDPVSSRGILQRGNVYLGFFPGIPFAVLNFQETMEIDPVRWSSDGELMIPESTAALVRRVFPERTETPERRISTIFIDPGHGGKDPGAIGRHQLDGRQQVIREKDLVLDVSQRLYSRLRQQYPDKNIVMSRSDDRYIELIDRYEMANDIPVDQNDAIIFVSVHANASINPSASGFEVWYLPPEFRRTLVTREDVDSEELVPILNSMREEEFTIQSILLGRSILGGMQNTVGTGVANRGLKQETFAVVRGARMPSVLIELGFLTNREEFQRLQESAYLNQLTEGIYNGIHEFIRSFEQ